MKKEYIQPQTEAILLAPSREMMDSIALATSNSASEPGIENEIPRRKFIGHLIYS